MVNYKMSDLLNLVLKKVASDLHIAVGLPPILRVDGELKPVGNVDPLSTEEAKSLVYEIMSPEQQVWFEGEKDLDFSFAFGTKARFRVNVSRDRGNIASALRLIPAQIRDIDQLGLPQVLKDLALKPRGLFLVTGPTGSGKSTTLAGMIEHVNRNRACHIVTIEDPIEYLYTSDKSVIHQREVGTDTRSFTEALRRVLRQDPDVILIGEMRDLETISSAVTAAETGHMVFATLHTPDAPQTIDRIIDVFPPHQQPQVRIQLSTILVGICCQQLVPLPKGGRICATELLIATPAARNLIREGKTPQIYNVIQTGLKMGMHTMDQKLAQLTLEGKIDAEEARIRAYDPLQYDRLLKDAQ